MAAHKGREVGVGARGSPTASVYSVLGSVVTSARGKQMNWGNKVVTGQSWGPRETDREGKARTVRTARFSQRW